MADKALTPEEARAAADKIDQTADRTRHLADPIAATLRLYADQAEELSRLRADNEALREGVRGANKTMDQCAKIVDRNLYRQLEKVQDAPNLLRAEIARLRSLVGGE